MSEESARRIERRRRYLRRLRGEKKGVSPVVATLILILIAVAAAAALYLWLVVWQGNLTNGIGQPSARPTLTIGGSTSVYPFDSLAVTQFQQNESNIVISNNQGGSGAGMLAVCAGQVNLGAASFPVDVPTLESAYGCGAQYASTIVVTTVAYDGVDVIVSTNNAHGLLSINYDTYALIWEDASKAASGSPSLLATSVNNQPIQAGIPTDAAGLTWSQIPAAVAGVSLVMYEGATAEPAATEAVSAHAPTVVAAAGVACGLTATVSAQTDICDGSVSGGAATGTPCGWVICAGGTGAGTGTGQYSAPITTVARSDASGTTQSFEARLIDATSKSAFATAAELASPTTGFNGCGSTNLISDCGYIASQTGNGNPGVISTTSLTPDAIAYASDGLARASGSGVAIVSFLGVGQVAGTGTGYVNGGIVPTTGGTGTIALGIKGMSTGYLGWRPFDIVSLTALSGTAQEFITFVMDPANNINLASESQEISVYSV